jgi:hypothetical protein
LEEVGRLSKTRVLTNDDATRDKVEEAMTRWLPSISKPDDTVLIFFSGTAMPLSQAAGVPSKENILPLYDFLTANRVKSMREQRTAGKLSTADIRQLEFAEQLSARAGGSEQGTLAVVRHWAISDSLFARWLQGLAGRQVLVILDSPYAAAFAPLDASSNAMSGAVSRLATLGQQELALLGAYGGQLSDVHRNPQGLSLMTELLIDSLQRSSSALTMDEAHAMIAARMESRLAKINEALESTGKASLIYKPYLVNHCKTPAQIKP